MSDLVGNHIAGFPTRRLKWQFQDEKKAEFLGPEGFPKELEYVEKAIDNFGSNGFAASKSVSCAYLVITHHIYYHHFYYNYNCYYHY